MRAIILKKNFIQDITGMIVEITVYASGQKGKEFANPKTDIKPTIDIKYCVKVVNNKPLMLYMSSMNIDFTKKIFYLSNERFDGASSVWVKNTINDIASINHAKNFREVWNLITTSINFV
jgi:hypothetical protein